MEQQTYADAGEVIRKFGEFIERHYYGKLLEQVRRGLRFLEVDFPLLAEFDPQLADYLLEQPEDAYTAANEAVRDFGLVPREETVYVRFFGLPESSKLMIRNIRSSHLDKVFVFEGSVRNKSEVRPQVTNARFECPSCGNVIPVLQLDNKKFIEPSRCSCGRKGKFKLLSKDLVDAQGLVLEEAADQLDGGEQPKRINILLKYDLVSPIGEKKTNPGSRVIICGVVKEVPIQLKSGAQSIKYDLIIEANSVQSVQEDFYDLIISEEEEEEIKKIAADPHYLAKLVQAVVPSIFGHDKIKEALLLQLVGGTRKVRDDGVVTRGDIHMLLIGDPGAGKSQMLKRISRVAPRGRFISGKGVSGAGLTASVVKDEFMGGWSLEAGALVLANRGVCCTTEDAEFIKEDGTKMSFGELFKNFRGEKFIVPKFKVLALDEKDLKVKPFAIKQAFKIRNDKRVLQIRTRTGRTLNLTDDNEVLTVAHAKLAWKPLREVGVGDYIAVPKSLPLLKSQNKNLLLAYLSGLVASDGTLTLDSRRGKVSFYNTDKTLALLFKNGLTQLGFKVSMRTQLPGRVSTIRGKKVVSRKPLFHVYSSEKKATKQFHDFGIPIGNKSTQQMLHPKLLCYSSDTLAAFMKGIFDGDGSVRSNPAEVIITSGSQENAQRYQEILLRLGIISSVERSRNSWHSSVRGGDACDLFFRKVGTRHPEKLARFAQLQLQEHKDRIDVLPHHQELFKTIIRKNRWKLGKYIYKYFWNYSKNSVAPSFSKLRQLNSSVCDEELEHLISSDILWDKIVSLEEVRADYVYDFTMKETNNFIANNIIMHNCIDELDKMSTDDRSAMHEALEGQTITISKANIQATLRCETTVLAAANPKLGRFDPYDTVVAQIDLPPALINRFDLIFPIKDLPDLKKDERMASFVLSLHRKAALNQATETEIDNNILRKYVAYARQKFQPILTEGAIDELRNYYISMRSHGGKQGGGLQTVQISARQLEALVRLSEANAKLRMSHVVEKADARKGIEILDFCLRQIAYDEATGTIDIDRIATDTPASKRNIIIKVKEIIKELEKSVGKVIPMEDIILACQQKSIPEEEVEEIIQKLKRQGDLFEPKKGFISQI